MLHTSSPKISHEAADDCTICLNALGSGVSLLTLPCGHKFHLQCLARNIKANNRACPLCRAPVGTTVTRLLADSSQVPIQSQQPLTLNHRSAPIFVSISCISIILMLHFVIYLQWLSAGSTVS